jgi:hypothetical protein
VAKLNVIVYGEEGDGNEMLPVHALLTHCVPYLEHYGVIVEHDLFSYELDANGVWSVFVEDGLFESF